MDINIGSLGAAGVLNPYWIPAIYCIALLLLSRYHRVFNEWGGVMQVFAGREIFHGEGYHGWTSHFWPPLFSSLCGLIENKTSGFTAGKIISIFSGSLLLLVVYFLAYILTESIEVGILSQVFLALNPLYFRESLKAHNHMLDALFYALGLTVFTNFIKAPIPVELGIAGFVFGIAGLTRYTSYVSIMLPFIFFFIYPFFKADEFTLIYWLGFAFASLPWWVVNARYNGSPIHNWDHLNVYQGVYPEKYGLSLRGLFDTANILETNSILKIFLINPKAYLRNVYRNFYHSVDNLIKASGILAPFVIPGFFMSFLILQPQEWLPVVGLLFMFVMLVSQAYVSRYYLLNQVVIMVLISVIFISDYTTQLSEKYPLLLEYHVYSFLIGILVLGGVVLIFLEVRKYSHEGDKNPFLADLEEVNAALLKHDTNINAKVIMAVDPARAYYLGAKYLSTPLIYDGPVEGLVTYDNMSERIKQYAPKYPSNMDIENLHADYLIYTRTSESTLPWDVVEPTQYDFLFDPKSKEIPACFNLIYLSSEVAVYEIKNN